jgi:PAS domain S-box-containing protein
VVSDDNYPPYIFKDDQGRLQGILIDQWQLWEQQTGIKVELQAMAWEEAQRRMRAREFDVIDTIFETPERKLYLDYTQPYARLEVTIFFHRNISGIHNIATLKGFPVAVKAGDSAEELLRGQGITTLVQFTNYESMVQAAAEHKIRVFVMDNPPALYYLNKLGLQDEFRQTAAISAGEFHRAVAKGDTELLHQLENGFNALPPDKLKRIDEHWMGSLVNPSPAWRWLGYVTLSGAVLVLALLAWNRSLNRLVVRRTAALEESRREASFLDHLVENSSQPVAVGDAAGSIMRFNTAFAHLTGYSRQELQAINWRHVLTPPEWRDLETRQLAQLSQSTPSVRYEKEIIRQDGSRVPVELLVNAVFDGSGHIPYYYGFISDITERRNNELRLRRLNRLHSQLSAVNHALVHSGASDDILATICRISVDKGGFKAAWIGLLDGAGKQLEVRAHSGGTPESLAALDQLLTGDGFAGTLTAQTLRSGLPRICNEIATDPVADTWREVAQRHSYQSMASLPLKLGERVSGVLNLYSPEANFFDPEAIRLLTNLATDLSFSLELTRQEAERKRVEDQLRQSQKMEAIGQLSGGIAHYFNNILTIIRGNASLLQAGFLSPQEQADCMQQIINASDRAAGLTRQLLLFSRKQELKLVPLDLNQVVDSTAKMLKRILGEDIVLRHDLEPRLPLVMADAGMIEQVLLNLAVNSRDAMASGGHLQISTCRKTVDRNNLFAGTALPPGTYVRLRVSDNGCGIASEILPRIFDPFFTTKDIGKGTGLGLATVHGIIKQHNGAIDVTSAPGKGTTFDIHLPICLEPGASPDGGSARSDTQAGHETILLVEDEDPLRHLTQRILQRYGYTVLIAPSGKAALELWKQHGHRVDLLLTDIVMPEGVSGFDLARELLKLKPGLKVIYTSGYNSAASEGVRLEEGNNFLSKPYTLQDMAKAVRQKLDAET